MSKTPTPDPETPSVGNMKGNQDDRRVQKEKETVHNYEVVH